ncbi:TRAP transporter substrate-binding protein, partial [Halococcus sp. IIIV-5B]
MAPNDERTRRTETGDSNASRRRFLKSAGAVGVVAAGGLAGCSGGGGGGNESGNG